MTASLLPCILIQYHKNGIERPKGVLRNLQNRKVCEKRRICRIFTVCFRVAFAHLSNLWNRSGRVFMVKVKPVQNGRTTRMSFSRINEVIGMPNLIEIQKNSYNWFLEEGPCTRFSTTLPRSRTTPATWCWSSLIIGWTKNPKYSIKECKERDATYAALLYVTARLFNKQTGEVKEQEIFMGDFPPMTGLRHLYFQRCRACDVSPASPFPVFSMVPARTVPARTCLPPP